MTEDGLAETSSGLLLNNSVMMSCQIGAAPVIPEVRSGSIGELSLFPTHTAVTYEGVYPIVQLSRLSLLVPVLTDTVLLGMTKLEFGPNAEVRAALSLKILFIIHATSGLTAATPFAGLFCS
jgi:hypothetical protein